MIDVFGDEIIENNTVEESVSKVPKLFDIINDISYTKKYLLNENTMNQYNCFMVNRAFSQHIDTILVAEELNRSGIVDKQMHHDFMFYTIKARKRYGKWAKNSDDKFIDLIINRYNINRQRAKEYLRLMTDEDKENIKQYNNTGGKS